MLFRSTGNALLDRIINIQFRAYFTEDDESCNDAEYTYKSNKYFVSDEFYKEHRCAFFKILTEYAYEYINNGLEIKRYIPKQIQKMSEEYVLTSNEVYRWFTENYKYVENNEEDNTVFISLRDAFNGFKKTETYINLSKEDKRSLTDDKFKEILVSDRKVARNFRDIHHYMENQTRKYARNVILSFTKIENE